VAHDKYQGMSEEVLKKELENQEDHPLQRYMETELGEKSLGAIEHLNWNSYLSKVKGPNDCRWMMLFGVSWCHWCRRFTPFFRDFAMNVNGKLTGDRCLKFGYVNCNSPEDAEFCKQMNAFAWPVVYMYDNGRVYEDSCGETDTTDLTFFEARYKEKFFTSSQAP
jgi:hypothetical protein